MKRSAVLILLLVLLFVVLLFVSTIKPEWTVEYLGNPSKGQYSDATQEEIHARNVWDLQYFAGKIYIGAGDHGKNAGPVKLNAINCETNNFIEIGEISEEEINNFKLIGGNLILPGIDAVSTESHEFGNWYTVSKDGKITKSRNIPTAAHCFDMVEYHGKIVAGIGGEKQQIAVSSDNGKSFSRISTLNNNGEEFDLTRVYDLMILNDKLYTYDLRSVPRIWLYNEEKECFIEQDYSRFYQVRFGWDKNINPGMPVARKINFQNGVVLVNSWIFFTRDMMNFDKVATFEDMFTDVLVRNDILYILGATKLANDQWKISIHSTTDLTNWKEVLSFEAATFARSFELSDNGGWYFGLGSPANSPHILNGEIIYVENKNNVV